MEGISNYKYSSCRLIIAKLNNDFDFSGGLCFISGMHESWERDYYIECPQLSAGKYLIFTEMDWNENTPNRLRTYNVTRYGIGRCKMVDESL